MTAPLVIYCDASVAHHRGNVAAWGAVFVRDGKIIAERSGDLDVQHSTTAEFLAALNALRIAMSESMIRRGDSVIVASDCNRIGLYADPKRPAFAERKKNARYRELGERIERFASKCKLELVVVWVKAHQKRSAECPHSKFNKRADKLARIASGVRKS